VLADEVGGDPVEPGPGVRPVEVEGPPPLERDAERLAEQLVAGVPPDPPHEEPEQDAGVPVVEGRELSRVVPRPGDDVGIGAGVHRLLCSPRRGGSSRITGGP
jgi:hypothetical protein